jgi:alanyl-tRNA synthetase
VYDTGALSSDTQSVAVTNVQTYAGYVLHTGTVDKGTLSVGDTISCSVDYDRR